MKIILKVNFISLFYALVLFIPIELLLNVYRISRLTGWSLDVVIIVIPLIILIGLLFSTWFIIRTMKKWLFTKKHRYGLAMMWAPYFMLFYYLFSYLFPLQSGESWFPIFNLFIYGIIGFYAFYVVLMNRFVTV